MKDQILKIAGVKSEKEFYKKYPTEEAFMKAHGKAFKKAEMGTAMVEKQLKQLTDFGNPPEAAVGQMLNAPVVNPAFKPISLTDVQNGVMANQQGITKEQYIKNQDVAQQDERDARNIAAVKGQSAGGAGTSMIGDLLQQFGEGEGNEDISKLGENLGDFGDAFAYGGEIPRADGGLAGLLGKAKSLFGNVSGTAVGAKPAGGGFDVNDIFGAKPKSTATLNSWTGKVSNPSGSVSKADTAALGFGDSAPTGGIGAGLNQTFGKMAGGINKGLDKLGGAGNVISSVTNIAKGIGQLKEQKTAKELAQQSVELSGLGLQTKNKPLEIAKHDFQRPENQRFTQNQMSPSYGTGSNVLTAADGAELKGYSNTYNDPYTLYSGLGYEPLEDSSIKQYGYGGNLPRAEFGDYFQDSGQASIGKGIGGGIGGALFGKPGQIVGEFLGGAAGNIFGGADAANELANLNSQNERQLNETAYADMGEGVRAQVAPYTKYGGKLEDGGYVSHNWNPQVITHFGDVTADDFYKASKEMRTGGSIRENDMYGTDYYPIAQNGYGKWSKVNNDPSGRVEVPTGPIDRTPQDTYIKSYSELNDRTTTSNDKQDYKQNLINSIYSKNMTAGQPADESYMYRRDDGNKSSEFLRMAPEGGQATNELRRTEERRPFLNMLGKKQLMERRDMLDENKAQGYMQQMNQSMPGGLPGMANGGAMNGKLQTHWGGDAEDISYNKYGAGTGLTSMLSGNSHSESDGNGNTGIGIGYAEDGQAIQGVDAEAQRNEPVVEIAGPDGKPTAHVAGKIKIPKYVADQIGDESAAGQTFQSYLGKALVKREKRANKNIQRGTDLINKSNPNDRFERPTFLSGEKILQAGEEELEGLVKIKEGAMHWQAAFNETAPEFGYDDSSKFVEDVNKGKINLKQAMFGNKLTTAQTGTEIEGQDGFWDPITHQFVQGSSMVGPAEPGLPEIDQKDYDEIKALYSQAEKTKKGTDVKKFQQRYHALFPEYARSVIGKDPLTTYAKANKYDIKDLRGNEDSIFGKRTKQYMAALKNIKKEVPKLPGRNITAPPPSVPTEEGYTPIEPGKIRVPWEPMVDQALEYFGKPLQKSLDSRQLAGEMYALSTNQLDPVRAQNINPVLLSPYQISLQDQMNANQADFNAMTRQAGNNNAALSTLAAQKYRANSGVLGEEFRINQGLGAGVYNQNRASLYENALKNMDIMNKQWMLQEEAKANTKATNIAALNSIADKYAKNASENFQGAIAQNLYPKFRYNAAGKAYVMPSFTNPINMPVIAAKGEAKTPGFADYIKSLGKKDTTKSANNGTIVKNFKKF